MVEMRQKRREIQRKKFEEAAADAAQTVDTRRVDQA